MMRAEDKTRPRPIVCEASVFSDVGEVRFPMRWLQRFFHKTRRVHKPNRAPVFFLLPLPPNIAEVEQKLQPTGQPTDGIRIAAFRASESVRGMPILWIVGVGILFLPCNRLNKGFFENTNLRS